MKCKSCGTEFTVHTRLPDGVYRCPNPHCPAPYVIERREPSTLKLVFISIFIIGMIFLVLLFKDYVSDNTSSSTITESKATTSRTAPATFDYYETTASTDTYSFIN